MCGPALAIIGTVVSAVGSFAQASAQADAANQQAAIYERQAKMERDAANYEATRQIDQQQRMLGTQRNEFLSSGVAIDTGSANTFLAEQTTETELDISATRYGGQVKSDNYKMKADLERSKADSTMVGGIIGGLSGVVNGFGKMGGTRLMQPRFA